MKDELRELGYKLVEDANQNEEFSAQRGLINELFPFIYEASKRMSSRAISRWLEANGTKLSPATIAKALRNPEPYWQEMLDEIEPAALTFARAHNLKAEEILKEHRLFCLLLERAPIIGGISGDAQEYLFEEYQSAAEKLKEEWFTLPGLAIEACLSSADFDDERADATAEEERARHHES